MYYLFLTLIGQGKFYQARIRIHKFRENSVKHVYTE